MIIWITGLSGAGKSTLAQEVVIRLKTSHKSVVLLDGDELREIFGSGADNTHNYDKEKRIELAMQYSRLCCALAAQEMTVVIATISLFKEVFLWNRENLTNYFEVYLRTPIDELRSRDPKKIYQRFDEGKLKNVAGLDLPIDEPTGADWIVDFDQNRAVTTVADELIQILNKWEKT